MKKNFKANAQLIKGGIQYVKGKITGSRKDKIKGITNYLEGSARKKLGRLL